MRIHIELMRELSAKLVLPISNARLVVTRQPIPETGIVVIELLVAAAGLAGVASSWDIHYILAFLEPVEL